MTTAPPDSVVADRRQRIRRGLRDAVGAAIAVTVVVLSVVPLSSGRAALFPAADSNRSTLTAYPERIGRQWWVRDLPERPGSIAAVVQMVTHDGLADWFAVSQSGYQWRIPIRPDGDDTYPTLSPNGRFLGYLDGDTGPYVIRDLVSGKRITFPEIGGETFGLTTRYAAFGQWPSFWSADSTRLTIGGWSRDDDTGRALLLNIDGTVRTLSNKSAYLAGWVGADALAWFDPSAAAADAGPAHGPFVVRITSIAGQPIRTVTLHPAQPQPQPRQGGLPGQWSAVASPDGTELVVLELGFPGAVVHRFSLADGAEPITPVAVSGFAPACPVSWVGSNLAIPVLPEPTDVSSTIVVKGGRADPVLAVESGLGTRCFIWATDALRGEGRGWPFGQSKRWWTWWWQEIALAIVLTVVAWPHWRRRRSRVGR